MCGLKIKPWSWVLIWCMILWYELCLHRANVWILIKNWHTVLVCKGSSILLLASLMSHNEVCNPAALLQLLHSHGFCCVSERHEKVLIMLCNHLLASWCSARESNHNAEVETCMWLQVSMCYWADGTPSFLICLLNISFQNPCQKAIAKKSDFQYRNWWWHWLGRCFHLFIFKSMLSFCTCWHVFPHSK